ncbi:MAG: hypothetical protein NE334_05960 [Lentisphaeraceae bacterium]|nr:hypothetical protein [Lentisphaeraceae bacterium]
MKSLFIFFSLFSTSLFAEIGMTKAECNQKYGEATPEPDNEGFIYTHKKLKITTYFENGKCWQIVYNSERKFSKSQFKLIVKKNCNEKYKLDNEDKREKSKHYRSKNFFIDTKEKEIVITYQPS